MATKKKKITVETVDASPRVETMSREAWYIQNKLTEIETWQRSLGESAALFITDLEKLRDREKVDPVDKKNIVAVIEATQELKRNLAPLDKAVQTATGKRINRARKFRPAHLQ